ncbi:MAG: dihydroorotase [Candidatus Thermoplasmatota archaeon]|nr:dihydroorotase [Candidatus Thermoplasmatota archaeon]
MFDLVIEGRVIREGSLHDAAICIEEGVIKEIRNTATSSSGERDDLGRLLLLPGLIDTHVHFRDPGHTAKEDFSTGTASAAFGGVTTVLDMPNNSPPIRDIRSFAEKSVDVRSKAHIDHGLYMGLDEGSSAEELIACLLGGDRSARPCAFKAFLGESTGSLSFGPIGGLSAWTSLLSGTGSVLAIHAEDDSLFSKAAAGEADPDILDRHDRRRPPAAEASALRQALKAVGPASQSLHVLHVSSEEGLGAVRGSGCTLEATPHHLLLDIKWGERSLENQAMCKVNPPLRRTLDRAALWKALLDGTISTLGSDHAPHLPSEKERGILSPSGIPGVETMGPLMLQKVKERKLPLERFMELLSEAPAKRFSMPGKGALKPGMDADIVVIDPSFSKRIRSEDLHSRCGWTPYEGFEGVFPIRTYSRGELIVENDVLCSKGGRGRNLFI